MPHRLEHIESDVDWRSPPKHQGIEPQPADGIEGQVNAARAVAAIGDWVTGLLAAAREPLPGEALRRLGA
jgi:hypothetical protein